MSKPFPRDARVLAPRVPQDAPLPDRPASSCRRSFRARISSARQTPPSRRITVAQIGCGRMGSEDMQGTMKHDLCRIVAVCDLDSKRLEKARSEVEQFYKGKGESRVDVKAYRDYHEVLARPRHRRRHRDAAGSLARARRRRGGAGRQGPPRPEAAHLRHRRGDRAADAPFARRGASCRPAASSVRRSRGTRSASRARRCATGASARSRWCASASARTSRRAGAAAAAGAAEPRLRDVARARARAARTWRIASIRRTATAGPAGSPPRTSASG